MRILVSERLFKVKNGTRTLCFVFIFKVNGKKFFNFFVVQKFLINHLSIMTSTYFLTTGTLCIPTYSTVIQNCFAVEEHFLEKIWKMCFKSVKSVFYRPIFMCYFVKNIIRLKYMFSLRSQKCQNSFMIFMGHHSVIHISLLWLLKYFNDSLKRTCRTTHVNKILLS